VQYHPLYEDRPAPTDHLSDPLVPLETTHALPRHAAVYGDEVDSILTVLLDRPEHIVARHLRGGPPLSHCLDGGLIDRNGPYWDLGGFDDRPPYLVDVAAHREIHDRVRARLDGRAQLRHFQIEIRVVR